MNEIKAILLCNNPIAVPSIREFIFYQKLVVICIPKRNKEMLAILTPLLTEANIPLVLLTKKDFEQQLIDAIHLYTPNVGVMMTFPYLLPISILQLPVKGFINFHYGLLPQCRGPQPIFKSYA
jgi:methionyl-tRNA formyltransferase